MSATNGGRPLPWHNAPPCRLQCPGRLVLVSDLGRPHYGPDDARVACAACGYGWRGTRLEVARARASGLAWDALQAGVVHPDKGCERCNAALMLDRERLCGPCVEKDMRERQQDMFTPRWSLPGTQHGGGT